MFILVYLSQGQDVRIQMSKLRSLGKAYWFNPRNGARTLIGPVENKGIRTFNAPGEAGERGNDWILILEADDTKQIYRIRESRLNILTGDCKNAGNAYLE